MSETDNKQAGKLLEHIESLTRHRDTTLLKVSLLNSMFALVKMESVHLYDVIERESGWFIALSAWSEGGEVHSLSDVPPEDQITPVAFHPIIAKSLSGGAACDNIRSEDGYVCCIPLVLMDRPVAVFELLCGNPLSAHELEVMHGIIGVFRNYLDLLQDSQHDTLTGLLNRKTFDHGFSGLLASMASAASQSGGERRDTSSDKHWLVVLDIDFFKRINDKFGHLYGDEVLILMSNLMRASFRQHDRLYRFGGEEFVVLMRNTDQESAEKKLNLFREKVAGYTFPQVGRVTVSIGYARVGPNDTPSIALGNADEALYYAKENGRNQVRNYEDLISSGKLTASLANQDAEFF